MEPVSDILRRGFEEYRQFINPFVSQRASLAGEPIKLIGVDGGALCDAEGRTVEDFHGTQAFGHRRAEIAQAIRDYLDSDAPSWYPSRVNPFAGRLARRLSERTGYDSVYLECTGSAAVEAALKLARALTRKPRLLGLQGGYHGCTFGSLSLMQEGYLRDAFGPHLPGAEALPFNDIAALEQALTAGEVAAVMVEPMQGEGGVRALSDEYVAALCELTEKHGALLIADEVQTGLGRTGRGFLRSSVWPRRPDAVVLGKHLGGGLIPITAMLTTRDLFKRAYGRDFASGESHNVTLGCNAVGAVAGLAALELITDELIERIAAAGARLKAGLHDALKDSPLFEEVRGEGLMMGVKLKQPDHPWLNFAHFGYSGLEDRPVISPLLCHRLYKRGFFCFTCGHDWSLFRLQPRFDIATETLDAFVVACTEELEYLCQLSA